jgi:hypothetical protein
VIGPEGNEITADIFFEILETYGLVEFQFLNAIIMDDEVEGCKWHTLPLSELEGLHRPQDGYCAAEKHPPETVESVCFEVLTEPTRRLVTFWPACIDCHAGMMKTARDVDF